MASKTNAMDLLDEIKTLQSIDRQLRELIDKKSKELKKIIGYDASRMSGIRGEIY